MMLLLLHTTLRNFDGPTLHSILAEVLLYAGLAMLLTANCWPEGTRCQCCHVLGGNVHFVEAVVACTAIMESLALQARLLDDEGGLLLIEVLLESLAPIRFVTA
jgi:hypothetical protein